MENQNKNVFGANPSPYDQRTVIHETTVTAPLLKGGVIYDLSDHLNQWYVGICTAISLIQNRRKANGKDYSWDFQYLLQKKYVDFDWNEGSSIFSALKVGKNFGFLPSSLWTHTTVEDLKLPYSQYLAKLQSITDSEISRLVALCVDKIPGYAQLDVSDLQGLGKAILDSEVGILCRYEVGAEWYSPSNPLKAPIKTIGAHAIGSTHFDFTVNLDTKLANTWGGWNGDGNANNNLETYTPSEAWIILKTAPVIKQPTLKIGAKGDAVKLLQNELNAIMPFALVADGGFGPKTLSAVKQFQATHNLNSDGVVGAKTWQAIDMIKIITNVCNQNNIDPLVGIAVATWEGGLNPKATLYNPPTKSMPNGSTDRGLFQWNDFYHKEISNADAFDPIKATQWFCKYVKANKRNLHGFWSASEKNWKKMLTPELLKEYNIA